ncbi:NADPH-dependent FMN reductase [Mesorhizobium sp. ZC-5]|uniref:NADPH-dependent FMN reductase n=1 Tax=Mesorhizobium sp. ZC-5 TaxID=2986066 RepID=UPI0021E89E78|nr:NAD(P)H-dependent oxidoreductase [Mesorhizobium sp. ZC-5]MCV3239268.1 NAD(P)H-dependent oxidoreductase [Mesorhizobium sp. ZC-5]
MAARILVFAGSIRTGAYSGKTADAAMKELAEQGAEVTRISLGDYPLPIMDQDLEKEEGVPENAYRLGRLIAAHDGMLICSPEYNASIPPLLKNALDWVSRIRKDGGRPFKPFEGKVAGLCSSSDGAFAGARGLYHLRAVLMHCQVEIITPQCSIARASEAFDQDGELKEEHSKKSMATVCRTLIERASMLSTRIEG